MSLSDSIFKYGKSKEEDIVNGLKSVDNTYRDELLNVYRYQGASGGFNIGMSPEEVEKDLEDGGYRVAAKTMMYKAGQAMESYLDESDKSEAVYKNIQSSVDSLINDLSSGGEALTERLSYLTSYDKEAGQATTVVRMNDDSFAQTQSDLDYALSESMVLEQ